MRVVQLLSAFSLASVVAASPSRSSFDPKHYKPQDVIRRDVAVVGGGSSGAYSAVSIKDKGKSVILIEKKGLLGGHAHTYNDPVTNTAVDLGVVIFHNIPAVTNFFKRFDIPIGPALSFYTDYLSADFRTGKVIPAYSPPQEAVGAALAAYDAARSKYSEYLNNAINLPEPVPEELYMPFGDFVKKYNLSAAMPTLYNYNPGVGDMVSNPTLEQFRYWGYDMIHSLSAGFISPTRHNTSELYAKVEAEFAASDSVLLNSEVIDSDRSDGAKGVKLIVRTPTGKKLIIAKKLLIAIPPKLDILAPYDLSRTEQNVFGKYINTGYWVCLLKNTGFPENQSIQNGVPTSEMKYSFPYLPAPYSFAPTEIPGYQMSTYATRQTSKSFPMSDDEVKAHYIKTVKLLQQANPDRFPAPAAEPEFVDFANHSPYTLQVRAKDIKEGFYKKLYALQGLRNTYWTGAAWLAEDTSRLWRFSEEQVVPQLMGSF